MSNGRKFRRHHATPPDHVRRAARESRCPDCDSEISLNRDKQGIWHVAIAHDDGCPQLTFRQRHGMMHSYLITSESGQPVPTELVNEVVDILTSDERLIALRIANDPHTTWQERAAIDATHDHDDAA